MVEKSAALDYSFRQGVEMCQYRIRELEGELDAAVKRAEAAERYLAAARKLHPGTFAIIDHTIDVSDSRDALRDRDAQLAAPQKALEGMNELCGNYFDEAGLVCDRDKFLWRQMLAALATDYGNGWRSPEEWDRLQAQAAAMRSWMTSKYRHDASCAARGPTFIGQEFPPCNCGLDAALASDAGAPLLAWIDRAAKALEPFADYAKHKDHRDGKDVHIGYYSPSPMMSDCDRAAEVLRDRP